MTTLFAQPYNIDATGFYFKSLDEYLDRADSNRDRYGQIVEEYEIQFIDGEQIDAAWAKARGLNQANISEFFNVTANSTEDEKIRFIIAVDEGGCSPEMNPHDCDITFYEAVSLKELAEQFVDEGLFGEIPENLSNYIDYDAIARDLRLEYSETEIAGRRYIYSCYL